MKKIRLQDLLSAVDGELQGEFQDLQVEISDVVIDSRKVKPLDVFFALVGERFDGHDFVGEIESGLGFVISKDLPQYSPNKFYVKVKDTEKALGDLAKWYKNLFQIPFIAVTGSVGKTTAKDMIASVLSSKYNVHKTQGNFNNTIGLPLTIFQLKEEHEICVLEMGMDTAGEIDYMANIVKPDVGIITNVGEAHIERLGSRDNIRKAKYEILPHLNSKGLFIRDKEDSESFAITVAKLEETPVLEGSTIASRALFSEYKAEFQKSDGISTITCVIMGEREQYANVVIPALGQHMFYPTMIAVAVGEHYGLVKEEIFQGIRGFIPTKMRMNQVNLRDNITVFDDCYNANPQSMKASLSVLATYKAKTKVAILGDMLELGEFSQDLHRSVGEFAGKQQIDILFAIGKESKAIGEAAKCSGVEQVFFSETKEACLSDLEQIVTSDMALLVKASRGMALESIVEFLKEQYK